MSNITKDQVIEWLSAQSVLDIANLVKDLETKWGVSAAAPVAVAAAGGAAASAPAARVCRVRAVHTARPHRPVPAGIPAANAWGGRAARRCAAWHRPAERHAAA